MARPMATKANVLGSQDREGMAGIEVAGVEVAEVGGAVIEAEVEAEEVVEALGRRKAAGSRGARWEEGNTSQFVSSPQLF